MNIPPELMVNALVKHEGAAYCCECGKAYAVSTKGYFVAKCKCLPLILAKIQLNDHSKKAPRESYAKTRQNKRRSK